MKNIILILSSVLLNASAQLFMRKGMMQVGDITNNLSIAIRALPNMITNLFLWMSIICYGISILLWMAVLSKVEVSFAYPFLSIGYIIAAIFGFMFFSENISLMRIAGIIIICIGVFFISRS